MTHPIPGADSERALPPLPEPWQHFPDAPEGSQKHFAEDQMADYVRADRAAAKVGANVAADENLALVIARLEQIAGNFSETPRELAEEALVCARRIAAGAPASPTGLLDNTSHEEGRHTISATLPRVHGCIPNPAHLAGAPAETPNQRTTDYHRGYQAGIEMGKALATDEAAQPSLAPIAGDVEKDAQQFERIRTAIANYVADNWPMRKLSIEDIVERINAIDAAMLANSSSGEAG